MQKSEALELCQQCPNFMKKGYCDYYAIEGARSEDIEPPACMLELLALTKSSVAKEPSSEGSEGTGKVAKAGADHPPAPSAAIEKVATVAIKPEAEKAKGSTHTPPTPPMLPQSAGINSSTVATIPKKSGSTMVTINSETQTRTEKRFLSLIQNGIISRNCLATSAKCSPKNVDKYLTKLRKKGLIGKGNTMVAIRGGTPPLSEGAQKERGYGNQAPYMRAHAHQFTVDILDRTENYEKLRLATPYYYDDSNRIVRNARNIEIYAPRGRSWDAPTVSEAMALSMNYFDNLISRLENQNSVVLVKDRVESIHLRKIHIGRVGDALADVVYSAKVCEKQFRVYHEDGTLRLLIDASPGKPEFEAVSITAPEDMTVCEEHYKDWVEKHPLKNSELEANLTETTKNLRETTKILNTAVAHISTQPTTQTPPIHSQPQKKREDNWSRIYG